VIWVVAVRELEPDRRAEEITESPFTSPSPFANQTPYGFVVFLRPVARRQTESGDLLCLMQQALVPREDFRPR
jgi:hypothetical protein